MFEGWLIAIFPNKYFVCNFWLGEGIGFRTSQGISKLDDIGGPGGSKFGKSIGPYVSIGWAKFLCLLKRQNNLLTIPLWKVVFLVIIKFEYLTELVRAVLKLWNLKRRSLWGRGWRCVTKVDKREVYGFINDHNVFFFNVFHYLWYFYSFYSFRREWGLKHGILDTSLREGRSTMCDKSGQKGGVRIKKSQKEKWTSFVNVF